MIHHGDCLEVMAGMEPESVDAVVTDPPYNLVSIGKRFGKEGSAPVKDDNFGGRYTRLARGFMGKEWDGDGVAFRPETWATALRLAKPSSYLLAFGGTRTVHRMTVAIEDAGWIIRDMLVWAYASGFPKSKASLKPAWEPVVMARKPGPLRELAVDACRIPMGDDDQSAYEAKQRSFAGSENTEGYGGFVPHTMPHERMTTAGRWPANVLLTSPIFDGGWDGVVGGGETGVSTGGRLLGSRFPMDVLAGKAESEPGDPGYGDSGTYSRFFLIPKADRADREPIGGLNAQRASRRRPVYPGELVGSDRVSGGDPRAVAGRLNHHPTVKPVDLMRHLVRLVTPTGGTVLDPFLGSGTTAIAAEMEGFDWIGIEKEAEYVAIAEARLNGTQRGLGLDVPAPVQPRKKMPPHVGPGETWVKGWVKRYADPPVTDKDRLARAKGSV